MEKFFIYGSAENIPFYDCRPYKFSMQDLLDKGRINMPLGISFILYGVIAEVCYVLAIVAMWTKHLRKLSCYKIMIVLGFYDMLAIAVNSLLTGYLWLVGGWFCTHPDLIYIAGCLGQGLWCGSCMNCFVLVLNRVIDLWNPALNEKIFRGNRTFLVCLIPLTYFLYFTLFTPPVLFNSQMIAWYYSPFISKDIDDNLYMNFPDVVNNLLIVVTTCVLYTLLATVLTHKLNQLPPGVREISGTQISIIFQVTAICMANLICSLVYVYMQFFSTPLWLVLIGHINWQMGHGIPAFVYLLINKTIQNELKQTVFGKRFSEPTITPIGRRNIPRIQVK